MSPIAYSTEATVVAGTVATAAWANTYVRDNVEWLATNAPSCFVFHSANQSLTTATPLISAADSESFDNASMHSTVTNNSRITIPSGGGGKYLLGAQGQLAANATGMRRVRLRKNGGTAWFSASNALVVSAADVSYLSVVSFLALAAGDYVEGEYYQSSGGALNLVADNGSSATTSPGLFAAWLRN